jgi:pimeloyl-ACP methyl ester carboxylesterase
MSNKALFVILVSGFTQNRGYFHGILKLREALIADGHSDGAARRVWYMTWKTNWNRVANELGILAAQHGFTPHVVLAGYSYGGWGALQLARQLGDSGIDVDSLILCDPVGRPAWWPRPLPAATSMLGRNWAPKLTVPANVHVCHSYYQQENRPQGHQLKPENGNELTNPIKLKVTHQRMDDAKEFYGRVRQEAARVSESL